MRRLAPLLLVVLAACRHPQHFVPFETLMPAVPVVVATTPPTSAVPVLAPASRARPTAPAAPYSDVWRRLGDCESGNDPKAVGGGGRFYGAFQQTPGSWATYGNGGPILDQPYAEQLAAAQRQEAAEGWRPWPVCGRRARGG